MGLEGLALKIALRPKVVHRLPGRLRIHLNALRTVSSDHHFIGEIISSLLLVPDGIRSADPCFETGNILIQYDPEAITEPEVLDYFKSLLGLLIHNRKRLLEVPEDRAHEVAGRLREFLAGAIRKRPVFDKKLEIPEDVLA